MPVYLLFLQVAKNNLQLALRGRERSEQVRGCVACETSELRRGTGGYFWEIRPQRVNFGNRKHIITQGQDILLIKSPKRQIPAFESDHVLLALRSLTLIDEML